MKFGHSNLIVFLFTDIRGLEDVEKVEEINKKYWYACQRYVEMRSLERNGSRNSATNGSNRFRELMLCLPEIRCVVGKLLNCDFSKLPLLFKVCVLARNYCGAYLSSSVLAYASLNHFEKKRSF